jgi:ubiquitin-activating enzyme E1
MSRALIVGCRGLGAEIAKNLLLSGIARIGLLDQGAVSIADLGSNFCFREQDVGRNRAAVLLERLQDVGCPCGSQRDDGDDDDDASMGRILVVPESSIQDSISSYHIVVATSGSIPQLARLNSLCRASSVPFIASRTRGLFSFVFSDLGDSFSFREKHEDSSSSVLIANITQDSPATVTVVEEQRHGLEDGDDVVFSGIKGMEELNQNTGARSSTYKVTVTGSHTFSIPVDTRGFGRYLSGGCFHKLNPMKTFSYIPLESALGNPIFSAMDNPKQSREPHIHVALQAIDEFTRSNNDKDSISNSDIDSILSRAKEIWAISGLSTSRCSTSHSKERIETSTLESEFSEEKGMGDMSSQRENGESTSEELHHNVRFPVSLGALDERLVKNLACAINVELCPLVALTGGLASQEVIKVYLICFPRVMKAYCLVGYAK